MNNPSTLTLATRYRLEPARAEYVVIIDAMVAANFNKSKAAELLFIDRKTLYNKLEKYRLEFSSDMDFPEVWLANMESVAKENCPDIGLPPKITCTDLPNIDQEAP